MADSLRMRVTRVIAGGAHALVDKIEDAAPVALLEQSVREVEQVTDDVRSELGRIVANRHLAQQQHLQLNKEHDGLSAAVTTALAGNREDLAKQAIARQLDIEAQLPILEASLNEMGQQDKELSGFVDALMGKKREMEKAIQDLELSRRLTETSNVRKSSAGTAETRLNSAQSAFDRTFRRQTGLNGTNSAGLEQTTKLNELNEMVRDNKISERLAALKASH